MTRDGRARKVLLLCADQLRADALGCYGNPVTRTPTLDGLAAGAVRFADHHSVTSPCAPARASLFTGLYPAAHRVVGNRTPFDPATPSLPGTLAQHGLPAYLIGYTDTAAPPFLGGIEGVLPGFELYRHFNLNEHGLQGWRDRLIAQGYPLPPEPMAVFDVAAPPARARYAAADSDSSYLAESIMSCLDEHRDEDWLIVGTFLRPHPPFVAPAPYDSLIDARDVPPPLPADGVRHPYFQALAEREPPGVDWPALRAVYHGLVSELDAQLGRVLEHLTRLRLDDEVLVVFTADHGDLLGDLGLSGPRTPNVASSRVPLLVRHPAGQPRVEPGPTESVDVAPTVLAYLGLPPIVDAPGRDLLDPSTRRAGAMTEQDFRDLGPEFRAKLGLGPHECSFLTWRTRRWTAVHFVGLPPLLFDRRSDPLEQRDLSGRPDACAPALAALRQLLDRRLVSAPQARADLQAVASGLAEALP